MKTKKEILQMADIIDIIRQTGGKQYASGMINGYLDAYGFEQFQWRDDNFLDGLEYFKKSFNN